MAGRGPEQPRTAYSESRAGVRRTGWRTEPVTSYARPVNKLTLQQWWAA
jgi:hypothetical protein